jgi:hypothetical protein
MNDRIRSIIEQARTLTPDERRLMFDLLEAEFASEASDGTPEEVEAAWLDEVKRRIVQSERGETTFVDLDEVMAKVQQLIRRDTQQ